jgi:hypothetical protein
VKLLYINVTCNNLFAPISLSRRTEKLFQAATDSISVDRIVALCRAGIDVNAGCNANSLIATNPNTGLSSGNDHAFTSIVDRKSNILI